MKIFTITSCLLWQLAAFAQQVPDTVFSFPVRVRSIEMNRLAVDAFHDNFHTLDGRFKPFGLLATQGGFSVSSFSGAFTPTSLAQCDVLVISNADNAALNDQQQGYGHSAFTPEEIAAVKNWVNDGGCLLLIICLLREQPPNWPLHFSSPFMMDLLSRAKTKAYFLLKRKAEHWPITPSPKESMKYGRLPDKHLISLKQPPAY
jgi:hypothetical protein